MNVWPGVKDEWPSTNVSIEDSPLLRLTAAQEFNAVSEKELLKKRIGRKLDGISQNATSKVLLNKPSM